MRLTASTLVVTLFASIPTNAADRFQPGCDVYFESLEQRQRIDKQCPPEGKTSSTLNEQQNRIKNNFCAHLDDRGRATTPIDLEESDFVALMEWIRNSGIRYGGYQEDELLLPEDRTELVAVYSVDGRDIGEGDFVRFTGYIANARYAPKKNGESVNCMVNKWYYKDIHLEMTTRSPSYRTRDGCRAWITAEVSPHLRPREWTVAALNAAKDNGNPVRVSGQLFFDGSHTACPESTHRLSSWEIHPVYWLEVCERFSLDDCPVDDPEVWIPLVYADEGD